MTTTVVTARPDTTFQQLVDLMFRNGVGGIPVVDDDGHPVGIVTESDLVTKEAYRSQRRPVPAASPVVFRQENTWSAKARGGCARELMSTPVRTARPDDLLRMAAARMVTTGVNRLPVVGDDGRLVGIVSRTDVLRLFHRTDDELTLDVRRLLDDPLVVPEGEAITAAVEGGVVTLHGTVRLPSHARIVDTLLRELTGAVDIIDQLRVEDRPLSSGVSVGTHEP
jgi:CBS domain-containing protein